MIDYLLVFIGGGIGACTRFGVELLVGSATIFPLHTFLVNVIGCFLAGIALGNGFGNIQELQSQYRFLVTGVLGGFTTFSAFGLQAVKLGQERQTTTSVVYVAATLTGCLLAVCLGSWLAKNFFNRA